MLLSFVIIYLIASIAIGLVAATRVHNTRDFVVAGRTLPLYVVTATVFATWFGAETVLGITSTFLKEGLRGIVADPFGSSLCLVLVGAFFAAKLYRMDLLTIGDYYRVRYNATAELLVSLSIVVSYLGWLSAQIVVIGLVFKVVTGGAVSMSEGILIGSVVVLIYTLWGGMFSVAWTNFVQMVIIVVGLPRLATGLPATSTWTHLPDLGKGEQHQNNHEQSSHPCCLRWSHYVCSFKMNSPSSLP